VDIKKLFKKINYTKTDINFFKYSQNTQKFKVRNINIYDLENKDLLRDIAELRLKNNFGFRKKIITNEETMFNWYKNIFFIDNSRILFLIFNQKNRLCGHIGFNYISKHCLEIDNVNKDNKCIDLKLYKILYSLEQLAINEFQTKKLYLTVLKSNLRAINLYANNGFSVINEINQIKKVNEEYIELIDSNFDDYSDDYLLEMEKLCE
jgi:RimJ/RimL family protein N-acetyltransferase